LLVESENRGYPDCFFAVEAAAAAAVNNAVEFSAARRA
jgi:hypothetical protein